ncbi:MAG: hypothetical protein CCU26_00450 [Nitrospira sp. UW-LDO-01]|nr:MAG: hypothetical protein CCU26_00450 [Nitrospira sp. UW-LDO-01]
MIRENNEEQPPEPPRANVGTRQHPLPEDTSPTTELTAKIIIEKYGENRLGTRPFHDETRRLLNMSSQLAHNLSAFAATFHTTKDETSWNESHEAKASYHHAKRRVRSSNRSPSMDYGSLP